MSDPNVPVSDGRSNLELHKISKILEAAQSLFPFRGLSVTGIPFVGDPGLFLAFMAREEGRAEVLRFFIDNINALLFGGDLELEQPEFEEEEDTPLSVDEYLDQYQRAHMSNVFQPKDPQTTDD